LRTLALLLALGTLVPRIDAATTLTARVMKIAEECAFPTNVHCRAETADDKKACGQCARWHFVTEETTKSTSLDGRRYKGAANLFVADAVEELHGVKIARGDGTTPFSADMFAHLERYDLVE